MEGLHCGGGIGDGGVPGAGGGVEEHGCGGRRWFESRDPMCWKGTGEIVFDTNCYREGKDSGQVKGAKCEGRSPHSVHRPPRNPKTPLPSTQHTTYLLALYNKSTLPAQLKTPITGRIHYGSMWVAPNKIHAWHMEMSRGRKPHTPHSAPTRTSPDL